MNLRLSAFDWIFLLHICDTEYLRYKFCNSIFTAPLLMDFDVVATVCTFHSYMHLYLHDIRFIEEGVVCCEMK